MKQKIQKEGNTVLAVFKIEEMKKVSQQFVWFARVFWLSNKTTKVEYGLIKAFRIHIERAKNIQPAWVRNIFFIH